MYTKEQVDAATRVVREMLEIHGAEGQVTVTNGRALVVSGYGIRADGSKLSAQLVLRDPESG